jgi:hypothetical protein
MNDDFPETPYDEAATRAVEIGNQLADANPDADYWDIADGLLAGALQYWLYTRQPCDDPECQECAPLATAEMRLKELARLVEELARSSEYFHSANDYGAGRA